MNYTDNLNLKKPEGTDVYNIENENDNMDIIDATIHEHEELLGKTNEAGHVKIIDHLNKTAVANGEALSAHQGNVITTLLAPVEPTTTASRAYAIGEQFVLNGLLTEATAAISQGNTIVVGTGGNAKLAADITSQLATLNSSLANCTSESLGYGLVLHKLGNIRIITGANQNIQFPSEGILLAEASKFNAIAVCTYFDDSSVKIGFLNIDGSRAYLRDQTVALTTGKYINGEIMYIV